MKKIRSFIVVLAMLLVFTFIVHRVCLSSSLIDNTGTFGTWYNTYKDLSYNAISQNLKEDSVLVMGSSEFRHGRKTVYHPKNLFKNSDIKLVTVGGPFNQTLFHTIVFGAVEPELKSKKVVLLVSPTWFKKTGITKSDYALRFSESEYIAFMENKDIPKSTKKYVAKRTEELLSENDSLCYRVKVINSVNLDNQDGTKRLMYGFVRRHAMDKDRITIGAAMKFMKLEKPESRLFINFKSDPVDWERLSDEARKNSKPFVENPFYMDKKSWNGKFKKICKRSKDSHLNDNYNNSPEYDDLKAFMEVAKANNIKVKLIILPVNGRWYDYTGMTADKRNVVNQNVEKLANKYGANYSSLSQYDYTKYITRDAVHPWNEGWVRIDEKIVKFINDNDKK